MTTKRTLARVIALGIAGLAPVLMAACTPYKPMGLMGGVDDLQLNDTTYRIIARGNGVTSSERVHDFVLLRASEIAISRGYHGFVVSGETDQSRTEQYTTPGHATTDTFVVGGFNGSPAIATSYTTISPSSTHTIFRPGVAIQVTLVQQGGMDAQMINATLAPKYGATPLVLPARLAAPSADDPVTPPTNPVPTTGVAPSQSGACTKDDEKRAYLARVTGTPYHLDCTSQ